MNYNLYLFSKLADDNCPEIKDVYEIDLKWDVLLELYRQYEQSPYPARMSLSDHDAMYQWMQDRKMNNFEEDKEKAIKNALSNLPDEGLFPNYSDADIFRAGMEEGIEWAIKYLNNK